MRKRRVAMSIVAILILLLAVFIYVSYRRDLTAACMRISSSSDVISTSRGRIEYADLGSGPPVLMIHGAGGGFDQGMEIAEPLINRGFRVIAPSRFGYLRTSLPADASPAAQADAHAALLDAVKLDRVAVIGASAGAPSAMQFCLRHPERCSALALLFPLAFAPHPEGEAVQEPSPLLKLMLKAISHSDFMFWTATTLLRNIMVRTILGTPIEDFRKATAEEQARALLLMPHILPVNQREKGLWNDSTIGPSIPRCDLENMRVPTLLISAEDDLYGTYRSARYTADYIPGARFLGFAAGGHLLLGHWSEASAEISSFLSGHR